MFDLIIYNAFNYLFKRREEIAGARFSSKTSDVAADLRGCQHHKSRSKGSRGLRGAGHARGWGSAFGGEGGQFGLEKGDENETNEPAHPFTNRWIDTLQKIGKQCY